MSEPSWTVYLIATDAGCTECAACGQDATASEDERSPGAFAYTDGLHAHGLPELQMWARPSEGDDPGADWSFSSRDLHAILNELASDVVAGRIRVGGTRTETYDDGAATVVFRLDEPVPPETVDAFRAHPDASVVPVRWSLHRAPPGPLGPADPETVDVVRTMLAQLRPRPSGVAWFPAGWRRDDLDFDPGGDLGPLTPMVRGLAAAVLGGRPDRLARFLVELACGYSTGIGAGHVRALAAAAARPIGRQPALDRVHDEVPRLVDPVVGRPGRWRAVVDDATGVLGGGWATAEQDLAVLLREGLLALLSTAVVFDVAEGDLLHGGLGPYRWSRLDELGCPPEFAAPPRAHRAVRDLLRRVTPGGLSAALAAHERTLAQQPYVEAVAHLQGLRVVTPVALGALDDVLPAAVLASVLRTGAVRPTWELLSLVMAAVACGDRAGDRAGDRLGDDRRAAFCAPYAVVLPGLAELVLRSRAHHAS